MNIFEPTDADIRLLTPSLRRLAQEYRGSLTPDPILCVRAAYRALGNPNIFIRFAVKGGELIGFFLGGLSVEMFTGAKIATQIGVMLLPGQTGHLQAFLNEFKAWAKEQRAKRIYMHFAESSERQDKIMKRRGYAPAGTHYMKEI